MNTITKIKAGLVGAAVALALPVGANDAKEQEVKLEDCPAAVQKTITDNANGGKIVEVEKSTSKDGAVVYEAEVKSADGAEFDIEVAADGKLIKVEGEDDNDEDADEA